MDNTVCALPGCDAPMIPGKVPYALGGHKDHYCSRPCVMKAYDLMKSGKTFAKKFNDTGKKGDKMEKPAKDFGDSGIIRRYCDACGSPVMICWKGRSGEYCSNKCMKDSEKEGNDMKNSTSTRSQAAASEESSPISAGVRKPAKTAKTTKTPKKAAAKATKKAAHAHKGPDATARVSRGGDAVIQMKDKIDHTRKGKAADALNALKDGITVADFRAAVKKKNPKNGDWYAGWALKTATESGDIKLKA